MESPTMTQDVTETLVDSSADTAADLPAPDDGASEEPLLAEELFEEISIDGMCGVY